MRAVATLLLTLGFMLCVFGIVCIVEQFCHWHSRRKLQDVKARRMFEHFGRN